MAPLRLSVSLLLLPLLACQAQNQDRQHPSQHRAVGDWHSTKSSSTLHLFADGSGAFETRACEWKEIDELRVKTVCEQALRDKAVLVFSVRVRNGKETGKLETYSQDVFVRGELVEKSEGRR